MMKRQASENGFDGMVFLLAAVLPVAVTNCDRHAVRPVHRYARFVGAIDRDRLEGGRGLSSQPWGSRPREGRRDRRAPPTLVSKREGRRPSADRRGRGKAGA